MPITPNQTPAGPNYCGSDTSADSNPTFFEDNTTIHPFVNKWVKLQPVRLYLLVIKTLERQNNSGRKNK